MKTNLEKYGKLICFNIEGMLIIFFMVFASLFHGLYFQREYVMANVVLMAYTVYLAFWGRGRLSINVAAASLLSFAAIYALSFTYAINRDGAVGEILKVIGYVPAFFIGLLWNRRQRYFFEKGILFSAVLVSVIGFMSYSGLLNFPDALYGERVQSTFSYANVTAVYYMIAIIVCLRRMCLHKGEDATGWHTIPTQWRIILRRYGTNINMYLLFCGFIMTYSRGMWIIFFLFSIFLLLSNALLDKWHKLRYVYLLVVSLASSVLIASSMNTKWSVIFLMGGLVLAVCPEFLPIWNYSRAIITLMTTGFVGICFFQNEIYTRLVSIHLTVTEWESRLMYYTGALKLIRDYPFWGVGPGGWVVVCEKYAGDYVKYVHNYYLQIACDVGLVGLSLFIIFICSILFSFFKRKQKDWYVFYIFLIILLHSAIDIDLHFQLIAVVFLVYGAQVQENSTRNGIII